MVAKNRFIRKTGGGGTEEVVNSTLGKARFAIGENESESESREGTEGTPDLVVEGTSYYGTEPGPAAEENGDYGEPWVAIPSEIERE